MPRLVSRVLRPATTMSATAIAFVGAALGLLAVACSKSPTPDPTTTSTTVDSLTTDAAAAAVTAPGAAPSTGLNSPSGPRLHHMEMFATACNGKSTNDPCSVQVGQRTIDGVCMVMPGGPNKGVMSCRPAPGQFSRGLRTMPNASAPPGTPPPPPPPPPAANAN